jgi:transglutaminase-like putative cysteine protease
MRLRIAHTTIRRYDPPAAGVIQVLRVTPRNHEGQSVIRWRIEVSARMHSATSPTSSPPMARSTP